MVGHHFLNVMVTSTPRQHLLFGTGEHPSAATGWKAHPMIQLGLSLESHPQPPDPCEMCRQEEEPPGVPLKATVISKGPGA